MSSWLGALSGKASRATWVLMLLAVVGLAAGWGTKAPCLGSVKDSAGRYEVNWTDWHQYRAYCYSDTIPLYGLERLSDGGLPYKTSWTDPGDGSTRYMEYPVMTGMLQYGAMLVTKGVVHTVEDATNPDPPEVVTYFDVMALILAAAWLVAVACTIPLAARKRDVVLMTLSPLVAVQVFTNFDPLAVMFACAGLLAWVRRRPGWAGVLLGLGAAAKLYPVFFLVPLLALCLRTGKTRLWGRAAAGAAVAWLAVNLPIAVPFPRGWFEFFRLNSVRPADHDSIYNAISVFTGWAGFDGPLAPNQVPTKLNLVSFALFALVCLGVVVVGLTAPRRPRLASLVFLVVAGFLITNKVWSPQYSLWLVPLGVLALPRWLPLLTWMSVDAFVWYPRMGYFLGLAEPGQGNSPQTFLKVVLLRDVLVLVVCGLILHTIYAPERDPVRQAGFDDPAGGPLDGADDVPAIRGRRRSRPPTAVGPSPRHAPRIPARPSEAETSLLAMLAVDPSLSSVGDWFSDSHRWPALAALAAAVILTGQPLTWRVLRFVVTIAHESGHAVAAVAARRQLAGVRLHSDTSGVTLSRGRPTGPGMILTAFAGYPAPCLLGVGFASLVGAGDIGLLLWILVGLLAALLTQIRNAFGALTVVGTGAAAVAVIVWGGPHLELAFASVLAWLLLVGGLRAVVELQRTRSRQRGRRVPVAALQSDADQLARLSHLPGLTWVGLFWLLAAAALGYGGYLMLN